MAEIKIKKKKTIWPWIIAGLLILAAIIYFLFFRNDHDDVVADTTTTAAADTTGMASTNQNNSAVTDYVAFINSDTATMGLDHVYTHTALVKLANATKAMADKAGYDVQADIDKAKGYTDKITDDPTATTHADNIKNAAGILSTALQNLQQAKYPQLSSEAQKVKEASADISMADVTLDQKHTVKTFFSDAADLLKKMN
ncbi:MAG: hypothetical protein M3Z56_11870 [Bacteroidota bacterium]|nr:hypothetical protein [Bacteroidota bacterium]